MKTWSAFTVLAALCVFLCASCAHVKFDSGQAEKIFTAYSQNAGKPSNVTALRFVQNHGTEKTVCTAEFRRDAPVKAEIIELRDNGALVYHYRFTPGGKLGSVESVSGSGTAMYVKESLKSPIEKLFVFLDGMLWGFGDAVKEVSLDNSARTRDIFKNTGASLGDGVEYLTLRFRKDYPVSELTVAVDVAAGDLKGAVLDGDSAFIYSDFSSEGDGIRLPRRMNTRGGAYILKWEINPVDKIEKIKLEKLK